MADLEQHAFKRDRRFIVRLVLFLIIGAIAGVWVAAQLTSAGTAGCAVRAGGGVTTPDAGAAQ